MSVLLEDMDGSILPDAEQTPDKSAGEMLAVRTGEDEGVWYRSQRIFCSDGSWYFHTREGIDVGPFKCHFDAELEASMLINRLRDTPYEEIQQVIRAHSVEAQGSAGMLNSPAFTDYLVETGGVELLADVPMSARGQ